MAFVDHHQRPHDPQHVAQALLDDQRVAAELLVGHFRHVQVVDLLAERLVRGKIVHVRKERRNRPLSWNIFSCSLVFAGRGLQHEQHHAEVVLHVLAGEGVALSPAV